MESLLVAGIGTGTTSSFSQPIAGTSAGTANTTVDRSRNNSSKNNNNNNNSDVEIAITNIAENFTFEQPSEMPQK